MIELERILRKLEFYHKGILLNFDDINIGIHPESLDKHLITHKFKIYFYETKEEINEDIVEITKIVKKDIGHFSRFSTPSKHHYTRWFYSFTSWYASGSLSLVPSVMVDGTIESREELGFELGKRYKVTYQVLGKKEDD